MGKAWDKAVPSVDIWKQCLRVLKPGAFCMVMSAPRSDVQMHMISNLTDAGFNLAFTPLYHTYASGFPKSMNITKQLKKRGIDRPELEGSYGGAQMKPAVEVVLVAMKPLSEKTFVDQALKNGKGITWLDDCRIPTNIEDIATLQAKASKNPRPVNSVYYQQVKTGIATQPNTAGRFPANLLVSDDVLNDGRVTKSTSGDRRGKTSIFQGEGDSIEPRMGITDSGSYSRYFDLDKWYEKGLPKEAQSYRLVDQTTDIISQTLPFLITPKASKSEKNRGLHAEHSLFVSKEALPASKDAHMAGMPLNGDGTARNKLAQSNHHPTVKPLKLMSYLITLASRPGDTVLDPFVGSGTTCLAAKNLSREYIGIEREAEYVEIARARLADHLILPQLPAEQPPLSKEESAKLSTVINTVQLSLI